MMVNDPSVVAEVAAVFARYEAALVANDLAVLDELFLDSELTIRYGIAENLYGSAAIREFRRLRPLAGPGRHLVQTVITSYGSDTAVVSTLFHNDSAPGKVGRQMQTWIRMPDGWRVAAAHVSVIDD
ncbi:MAG TPA: oxalurate catabolism protein HpxZ [Devosia sp.]|jgi:hypothetical protein|uniref:oxalurate catabolism protein HpxZ n=1 Tax=Devosia sp. TaxID=1871048 RepID=UPI002DDD39D6|nr:oxalurate catabolism protein HpxZ [Devosia sp.]HEV2516710.1 oxalurate catabolism protein HpxZ [Devosia sp.]